MINSIQHFQTEGVKNIQNIFTQFGDDMTRFAEMVYGVTEEVTKPGLSLIAEEFESYDELLRRREEIRKGWHIVRRDETTLTTSLGNVVYKKTLFRNRNSGVYSYLLDDLMGIKSHTGITEDALARILDEAVETSYRRGGKNACITGGDISRMAVMNRIHALEFPEAEAAHPGKAVETLYIDADEDHVSLQYLEKKGDIRKPRINTVMPRPAYVYEGIDTEEDGRPKLTGTKYFGGLYEGKDGNRDFRNWVYEYIASSYDASKLKTVYINGDGAPWIRSGTSYIPGARFVLDKYHMHKYITATTSHLEGSAEDARSDIYRAIHKKKKKLAEETFDRILSITEKETKQRSVRVAKKYILANRAGIMLSVKGSDPNVQCSAEGHVAMYMRTE